LYGKHKGTGSRLIYIENRERPDFSRTEGDGIMMDREYAEECLKEMEREKEEKIKAFELLNEDSSIEELEAFCEMYYPDITEKEIFEEYKEFKVDQKEDEIKHNDSMRLSFYQLKEKGEKVISDCSLDIYVKFFQKNNISEDKYRLERECFFCGKRFIYSKINNNFCNENCKNLYENFKEAITIIEFDHCQRRWNGMNKKKSLSLRNEAIEKVEEKIDPEIRKVFKKPKKSKEQVKIILIDTSVELFEPEEEIIIFDNEFYRNYLIESIEEHVEREEFEEREREYEEERYKAWQLDCQLSGQGEYECCECGRTFSLANLIADKHYPEIYCKECLNKNDDDFISELQKIILNCFSCGKSYETFEKGNKKFSDVCNDCLKEEETLSTEDKLFTKKNSNK
jgi:hypothetical protein